jgi:hypothetical protein
MRKLEISEKEGKDHPQPPGGNIRIQRCPQQYGEQRQSSVPRHVAVTTTRRWILTDGLPEEVDCTGEQRN